MPDTARAQTAAPAGRLRLTGVERTFSTAEGERTVLGDVTLEVEAGEIIVVVGASGCGKSTLLRLIAGLDAPTTGTISLDGERVRAHDDATAVAFQEPRLLPWRTIAQNVAIGLPRGTRTHEARARVAELLALLGLSHAATQRPREVSGGMAQRASLARALARRPRVLLLDEPFGALDALTRLKMHDLLLDLHRAQPTTIVLVTHDVEEALYLADRVLMLRTLRALAPSPAARPKTSDPVMGSGGTGSIAQLIDVPGTRPRDRGARSFTELRRELLAGLGVHAPAPERDPAHAPAPASPHESNPEHTPAAEESA